MSAIGGEEESLARLMSRRAAHRGAATRILGGAHGIRDGDTSTDDKRARIQVQINLLTNKIDQLRDIDDRIQKVIDDGLLEAEIGAAEDHIIRLQQQKGELEQFIQTLLPVERATHDDDNASVASQVSSTFQSIAAQMMRGSHRLPTLSLPTFSGNILNWNAFWDSFRCEVHSQENLSNVTKFTYLRAQLSGEPLRLIAGFSLQDDNYPLAVDMLKENYGKPSRIADAHFRALQGLPPVADNLQSLKSFHHSLEGHIRSLEALGKQTDSYGAILICSLMDKIHHNIRRDIIRAHKTEEWTLDELRTALSNELNIMESSQSITRFGSSNKDQSGSNNYTVLNNAVSGEQTRSCLFCGENNHKAYQCTNVKSVDERWKIVKQKKLCHNCLSTGHQLKDCKSKRTCYQCKKSHHTSLHDDSRVKQKQPSVAPAAQPAPAAPAAAPSSATYTRSSGPIQDITTVVAISEFSEILLKTAVAPVVSHIAIIDAQLLMDDGSQRSFITTHLQRELQLPIIRYDSVSLSAFGSTSKQFETLPVAEFHIISIDGEHILIQALVKSHIANPIRNRLAGAPQRYFKHLQGLRLAHPIMQDETFRIDILIGSDFYYKIILDRIIRGTGPVAVESRLGYLLSGPTGEPSSTTETSTFTVNVDEFDLSLFWRTDAIGILPEREEDDWLKDYKKDRIFFNDGQYGALLPWKPSHQPLDSNLGVCQARTRNMVRRLFKNPTMLHDYDAILREQISKGYIEVVNEDPPATKGVHYINHHGVLKPESTTTPLRIVYDCSCKTQAGVSLNDCLEEGPPLQNNMLHLYLRFRLYPVGLLSDIEKAFHRIQLHSTEKDYFRFLFISDPTNPESTFKIYRFVVLPFGANCSPFILHAVLQTLLEKQHSSVAIDLGRNTYVDNVVT